MQIKIFTLPIYSSERSEDELNRFLRSHRVLQTERHFSPDNGGYWTILVEYLDGDPTAEVPPTSRREKKLPLPSNLCHVAHTQMKVGEKTVVSFSIS